MYAHSVAVSTDEEMLYNQLRWCYKIAILGTPNSETIKQRFSERGRTMDNVTFGVTMMVCGMGGTILTLWIMSLIMRLLGRFFPYKKEEE